MGGYITWDCGAEDFSWWIWMSVMAKWAFVKVKVAYEEREEKEILQ